MPEKPRRQRGHDGCARAQRLRIHAERGGSRRSGRQHLQFHRPGAEGIDRHNPGNGRAQEIRRSQKIDRCRLPGGALSRTDSGADSRGRRGGGHGRSRKYSGSGSGPAAIGRREIRGGVAFIPVSRPDAANSFHAQACRIHQDRRGLRPSLHVLHYSAASREIP